MIEGGIGGANTGTGLEFERNADFKTLILEQADYSIRKCEGEAGEGVFYQGKKVARCFKKHDFYTFLEEFGINWKEIISKKLLTKCLKSTNGLSLSYWRLKKICSDFM